MKLPAIFEKKMQELLGDEYGDFLKSYDKKRLYGLRVNTLKISCEEFEKIAPFEIKKIPWIPNGYYYNEDAQPSKHPYYHAGLYYLQEPSAMTPASRLPVDEGDAVLDLCAAPGGKATELGAKLGGSGILVANDISSSRAKALLKNIELFGITNPFVVSENPAKLAMYFENFFDKILLDAPCSGEGMFRKDPSVIKNYEKSDTAYYEKLQREIIPPAISMLKPGGMLMYSTCTFSPGENECQISRLLKDNPDMELVSMEGYKGFDCGHPEWAAGNEEPDEELNEELKKCVRIWPHRMEGEGHFLALLKKSGGKTLSDCLMPGKTLSGRLSSKMLREPLKGSIKKRLEYYYEFAADLGMDIDESRFEIRGDRLYYMPPFPEKLTGMRFLRNGLYMGDLLNKRFEPSQALAMAIRPGEYEKTISLRNNDIRVIKYLKGETIEIGVAEDAGRGLRLVCVDGYPLGWGKLNNGILKNKYHPGWRLM